MCKKFYRNSQQNNSKHLTYYIDTVLTNNMFNLRRSLEHCKDNNNVTNYRDYDVLKFKFGAQ